MRPNLHTAEVRVTVSGNTLEWTAALACD